VWDTATGREVGVLAGQGQAILKLAFSPDGRRLLVFSVGGTLQLWGTAAKGPQVLLRIPCRAALGDTLSPDQRFLFGLRAISGQLWAVAPGRKRADLPGQLPVLVQSPALFSPDGRRFAYTTEDHAIHIWDLEDGAEAHVLRGHSSYVRALAFSPDGKRL